MDTRVARYGSRHGGTLRHTHAPKSSRWIPLSSFMAHRPAAPAAPRHRTRRASSPVIAADQIAVRLAPSNEPVASPTDYGQLAALALLLQGAHAQPGDPRGLGKGQQLIRARSSSAGRRVPYG